MHSSPVLKEALTLALLLVIYNNGTLAGFWALGKLAEGFWGYLNPLLNIFTALGLLGWALVIKGFTLEELGLSPKDFWNRVVAGVGLGILMAIPPLLFFAFPLVVPGRVHWAPGERMAFGEWLSYILIVGLLSTSFFEELAFRGVLDAQLRLFMPRRKAVIWGSVVFVFWHGAIHYLAYSQTNLPAAGLWLTALVMTGGFGVYFVAGVIFSLMRHRSGSLIVPIMAHWVVNSIMVSSFYLGSLG